MDQNQEGNNTFGYQGAPGSTPGSAPYPQEAYTSASSPQPQKTSQTPAYPQQPQPPPQVIPQNPTPQGVPYQGTAGYPQRSPYPQQGAPNAPYPQPYPAGTPYPAPQGTVYQNPPHGQTAQPPATPYGAPNAAQPYPRAYQNAPQAPYPSGAPYQGAPQTAPQPYPPGTPYPQTPQANYGQPAQNPYGGQSYNPIPHPQAPIAAPIPPPQTAPVVPVAPVISAPVSPSLPDHSNVIPQNITVESMANFLNTPTPHVPQTQNIFIQPPTPASAAGQQIQTPQHEAHTEPLQKHIPQAPHIAPPAPPVQPQLKLADSTNPEDWRAWLGDSYVQKRGVEVMQAVIADLRQGKRIDMPVILRMIEDFVVSCKRNEEHFVTLARVKDEDNYSFHHPVNVAIYSISIGSVMQYNNKQLSRLGLSALLHDIGEIKLPARMLNKSAKFTETELASMQKHPAYGYEILKKDPTIPEDVLLGVFHHHERLDGSGYPSGHFGRFIHPLGKIIALAETFDAMTSNRSNASGILPTDALKTLYGLAGKHYEPNAVKALIMLLGMYPMGSLIRLNTGELAVVFTKNKEDLSRPNIIMITDRNGQPIEPFIVNLYKDKGDRKIIICENAQNLQIDTNKYIQDFLVAQQKG